MRRADRVSESLLASGRFWRRCASRRRVCRFRRRCISRRDRRIGGLRRCRRSRRRRLRGRWRLGRRRCLGRSRRGRGCQGDVRRRNDSLRLLVGRLRRRQDKRRGQIRRDHRRGCRRRLTSDGAGREQQGCYTGSGGRQWQQHAHHAGQALPGPLTDAGCKRTRRTRVCIGRGSRRVVEHGLGLDREGVRRSTRPSVGGAAT